MNKRNFFFFFFFLFFSFLSYCRSFVKKAFVVVVVVALNCDELEVWHFQQLTLIGQQLTI